MPIYPVKNVKRDGMQKYRVVINYIDRSGKYKKVERTVYGKSNAVVKEEELRLMYCAKGEQSYQSITVQQLYDEYIKSKGYEVRESTLDKSKRILKGRVLDTMGDKKIDKLFPQVLQEWKHHIEEIDSITKLSTKKGIYKEFHALMNYAVKMDYLTVNPLDKVGNFKSAYEGKKEMLFYTPEEFKKYITAARNYCKEQEKKGFYGSWNYYVFFMIAFFTGMRKGEINALTWQDIENNTIHITKSINQKLKGGDRITPPKNSASIRDIQMPPQLVTAIEEHKARYKQLPSFRESLFICGGEMSVRDSTVSLMNETFAELAGVKVIRIHDFRHSHASLLANKGISIHEIARRLGHSDIKMTLQTYSHLYPSETERALSVLREVKI